MIMISNRLRRPSALPTLLTALTLGLAIALPAPAAILPADRSTTWSPGVTTGIPARTTICATVNASTYGGGTSEASAGIQSAINACPVGQVVQLSAGTFKINANYLLISKGITLRGAGAGTTILNRTNGSVMGSDTPIVADPLLIIGPNRWPKTNDNASKNLTADGVKGAYSVTVSSSAGFAAGQIVILDEDHLNTGTWQSLPNRNGSPTSVKIWATDRLVWQRHNPSSGEDDPFPDAAGWFSRQGRPLNEVKEVASVSGNVITFTTPLHITYRVAYAAQLTPYVDTHVRNAGVEALTVRGGGDGNLRFEAAAYSWAKGIEDMNWLGEGVAINNSFRIEVRDSYIHDTAWPSPGGGGYAVSLANGSAEALIENNIIMQVNKVMVARSCGAGSVVGYNYTDDGHIGYDPTWVEVGINGSHMVGSHHMLFEGNYSWNYDADNTHGSSIYHTVFRNHLSGFRRDYTGMSNARTAGLLYGSWWHSFVGNVMGTAGRMSGWVYENPGVPNWDVVGPSIWKLGYDPIHWEQDPDPKVRSTVLREGNYDYVTGQVRWDTTAQPIPNSLYLSAKPAFFGSLTWPWVDPTGTTKLYTLPAKARFDAGTPFAPPPGGGSALPAPSNLRVL
jgi:hypothetical protein